MTRTPNAPLSVVASPIDAVDTVNDVNSPPRRPTHEIHYFPRYVDPYHIDLFDRLTEGLMWIEDRNVMIEARGGGGRLVPLRMRKTQRRIIGEMMRQAATCPRCGVQRYGYSPVFWTCKPCSKDVGRPVYRGIPVRIIITKARKEGVTTIVSTVADHLVKHYPHQHAMLCAHEGESTRDIFDSVLRIHTAGRSDTGLITRPKRIAEPWGSTFDARTGAGAFVGTGGNLTIALISELAKIIGTRNGKAVDVELLASLKNAVPMEPHTIVVIESTGMGPKGDFHRRCRHARDAQLKGLPTVEDGFVLLFFPWWEDDDYKRELPLNFELNPVEIEIREQVQSEAGVHLTDEQLYWYRLKRIEEQIDDNDVVGENTFRREYPSIFDDCFSAMEGRVYPQFSGGRRHMHKIDLRPWYQLIDDAPKDDEGRVLLWEHSDRMGLFRGMDVGFSGKHKWVVVFGVYDNRKPPSLSIDPNDNGCLRLRDELLAYAWDPIRDRPKEENDHGPDAIRYPVTDLKLCGQVHIFKALYYAQAADLPGGAQETVARDIYEASGWELPEDADPRQIDLYRPAFGALQFTHDICDPRALAQLDQFPRWGLDFVAADTRPPKSHITNKRVDNEVNWGVSRLAKLISGKAFFDPLDDRTSIEELAEQAGQALTGQGMPFFRPMAITDEQREALARQRIRSSGRGGML